MDNVRTSFLVETTYFKNVNEIQDIYEDEYDNENEANDPGNPIWEGSEVHWTPTGNDPTVPDANDVNQD